MRREIEQMQGQFTNAMDLKDEEIIRLRRREDEASSMLPVRNVHSLEAMGTPLHPESVVATPILEPAATATQAPHTGVQAEMASTPVATPTPCAASALVRLPRAGSFPSEPRADSPFEGPPRDGNIGAANDQEKAEEASKRHNGEEAVRKSAVRPAAHVHRMMRADAPKDSRAYQVSAWCLEDANPC